MTVTHFVTTERTVVPAITADQMREVDRIAIEETGPNLFQMMENAGRSLAGVAIDMLGEEPADRLVVVLSGTGGNGGGGICAARHLANRDIDVTLVITDESRMGPVPAEQLSTYRASGGREASLFQLDGLQFSLVVDAIIGYSLDGQPVGTPFELIEWANSSATPVLSLDVPSGVDSTSGEAPGAHVEATETLTLALPKTGLGVDAVGSLRLADIGIPQETYRRVDLEVPASLFGDNWVVSIQSD